MIAALIFVLLLLLTGFVPSEAFTPKQRGIVGVILAVLFFGYMFGFGPWHR